MRGAVPGLARPHPRLVMQALRRSVPSLLDNAFADIIPRESLLLDDDEGVAAGISLAAVWDGSNVQLRKIQRLFGPFHLVAHAPHACASEVDSRKTHLGVNRCLLGELWHALRDQDLPAEAKKLLNNVTGLSAEREEAIRLAFTGIYKVLSPACDMSAGEAEELLQFVLEMRHLTEA